MAAGCGMAQVASGLRKRGYSRRLGSARYLQIPAALPGAAGKRRQGPVSSDRTPMALRVAQDLRRNTAAPPPSLRGKIVRMQLRPTSCGAHCSSSSSVRAAGAMRPPCASGCTVAPSFTKEAASGTATTIGTAGGAGSGGRMRVYTRDPKTNSARPENKKRGMPAYTARPENKPRATRKQKATVSKEALKSASPKERPFRTAIRTATMGDAATDEELPRSVYELQTQGNIAQNKRKLQQLGLDKPAIQTSAKAKAKGKAKTPSAAAAASTTVALRGRTAAAADPKEAGKKRENEEPHREAVRAVQNLGRRRLDSMERASRSLRQRRALSHHLCASMQLFKWAASSCFLRVGSRRSTWRGP